MKTKLAELVLGRPTLTDIAREAGVSVSYISAIASGRKHPSDRVKVAAARVLGLSVHTLFPEVADHE